MILRHATPARNLASILRLGLLCSHSKGKLPVVWACSPSRSSWAVLHVIKRHGGKVESTVVLEIDVPRSWLRRSAKKRVWTCPRDIPPGRILRVLCFAELAGASTDE
jgi:hypothetical protein